MNKYQPILNFIRSLYPEKDIIALHEPSFTGNEKKYVAECIDSTFVSSVGPFVPKFEEAVATFVGQGGGPRFRGDDKEARDVGTHTCVHRDVDVGTHNCVHFGVACMNGTAALHLALTMTGVKAGDEVITQPLSFIATANPIVYIGAHPVFIDVDEDTLGLSPARLKSFLENNATVRGGKCVNIKTGRIIRACVPMHTFGNPCRIDEIVEICDEFHIDVIEDAAESIGSWYKGKHTGTFGKMGIFSFNGNKTITTGGGGMVITKDGSMYALLRHMSTQAKKPHAWEFAHDAIAYNYRLPNVNAAMGVAQMETIDQKLASKRLVAQKYSVFFKEMGIPTINEIAGAASNFWLNGIFLENRTQRNEFLQLAVSQNIHCRPAWELLPTLEMYKHYQCENISTAQRISDTLVNLPSSPL